MKNHIWGGYTYNDVFRAKNILSKNITSHELAFEFIAILEENLIELANKTKTLYDLNAFIQQDKKSRMHVNLDSTQFTLVLAYLANDPNFNKLADELSRIKKLEITSNSKRLNYQTEYAKLLKYLREEVKPLV